MSNEIIQIENMNALEVFGKNNGLDPIIERIKTEVRAEVLDISTKDGRENIGSLARKIGSAKVKLKNMSKELTEDWRLKTKAVTSEATRMESELDALRDEVKAPLDEYNNREKVRTEEHEELLRFIAADLVGIAPDSHINIFDQNLLSLEELSKRDWEEFSNRAIEAIKVTENYLKGAKAARLKSIAEQEELERLRKEEAERQKKERDEKIAADAKAEADRKAADEAKVLADKVAAEKAEADRKVQEADAALKKAEEDRIVAAKKSEDDKLQAIQDEKDRVAAEEKAEADAAAAREADKTHHAKINNEAREALLDSCHYQDISTDIALEIARQVVVAIAQGKIPHIKIQY